jgi:hypothetical protein
MNTIHRLFAVACLSLASLAGCAADGTSGADAERTEAAPQVTVVRYGATDFAALKPGELLRVDLTLPSTVYLVQSPGPADLQRTLVVQSDGDYILGERIPAAYTQGNALGEVILSSDPDLVAQYAGLESTEPTTPVAGGDERIGAAVEALRFTCKTCVVTGGVAVCTSCTFG